MYKIGASFLHGFWEIVGRGYFVVNASLMRSRKVFRIYAALPDDERAAFGCYLASPYFNVGQRLVDFRQLLEEALVQRPDQDLTAEEAWKLLPGVATDYRPNGFDKLCSELLTALNDFLAVQEFRAHPATVASHQLGAYVERHLDEWVPGMFEALVERLGKDLERDAEGLYAHMSLLHAYGRYMFRHERMPQAEQLVRIDRKLNESFFARKLELAAAMDAYNKSFKSSITLPHLNLLKEEFEAGGKEYPVLLQAQSLAWLMSHFHLPGHYFALKMLLQKEEGSLPLDEVKTLYRLMMNFCLGQVNLENESFEAELDELYRTLLANGLLLSGGKLSPAHFKNIVQMGLRTGDLQWVELFVHEWGERLTEDHFGCALRYNLAALSFHKGEFSKCLKEMEVVMRDYKADVYYGLDSRIYGLMALFELNKEEDRVQEFDARLNAFRLYLIRDEKLGDAKKKRPLNLVKQFRRLMGLYHQPESERQKKAIAVLKGFESLKPAANRKWFERQVAELVEGSGPSRGGA